MLVKPAPGLRVRDPRMPKRLVTIGEHVDEHDLAWHRLIRDGDLVECSQAEAEEAEQTRIDEVAAPEPEAPEPEAPEPEASENAPQQPADELPKAAPDRAKRPEAEA